MQAGDGLPKLPLPLSLYYFDLSTLSSSNRLNFVKDPQDIIIQVLYLVGPLTMDSVDWLLTDSALFRLLNSEANFWSITKFSWNTSNLELLFSNFNSFFIQRLALIITEFVLIRIFLDCRYTRSKGWRGNCMRSMGWLFILFRRIFIDHLEPVDWADGMETILQHIPWILRKPFARYAWQSLLHAPSIANDEA